jgi:adenylate cyclase, class 2
MQEVEVKAWVRDEERLISALLEHGVRLGEPVRQLDSVYAKENWRNDPERKVLRIRRQAGHSFLTLKQNGRNELDSLEHETGIDDPEAVEAMLPLLGYELVVEVDKSRRKGPLGEMEICVDEVSGIGTFIEADRLLEVDIKAQAVQEELFDFLESIGVSRDERENRGYDTLVRLSKEGDL